MSSEIYNIYCDESCHLEHDDSNVMALGAVWCPRDNIRTINKQIQEIKSRYGVPPLAEIKWTKVSPVKEELYLDIVDYFFNEAALNFRGLVVPDKSILDHERFNQTHNIWYYKMYFDLLKVIFAPNNSYFVYIDVKDTHSPENIRELQEFCSNNARDFSAQIIKRIQPIRSYEVQLMQIVDILTGAIAYQNRIFPSDHICSEAKLRVVDRIIERSGCNLKQTTFYREQKMNLLIWEPGR